MGANVTVEDEGKAVIDANGEWLGTVRTVEDGTALVDPAGQLDPTVTRALGWTNGPDVYPLHAPSIEIITESSIRLRSNL